jgi:hypothetical protein
LKKDKIILAVEYSFVLRFLLQAAMPGFDLKLNSAMKKVLKKVKKSVDIQIQKRRMLNSSHLGG